MAEAKTKPTDVPVADFINTIGDEKVIADCNTIIKMMQKATGYKPIMWGPAIVGFGTYTLTYASGKTAEWPRLAFSPRKATLTLYLVMDDNLLAIATKLGKHKTSKACLYIKRLSDVDLTVLQQMIEYSVEAMNKLYPVK